jgi:hypothetical protein
MKPNILNGKYRKVKIVDIMALLYNVLEGAKNPNVGFEDTRETVDTMTRKLNKVFWLEDKVIESALFNANLMNENGLFWHPKGLTFEQFTKQFLKKDEKYNNRYGTFDKKE